MTDPEEAVRCPELGVLSAMAHGETEKGRTIADAVLPAVWGLDDDRARFYHDLVYTSLNDAARRSLEAEMKGYQYQSDFAKKYVAQGRTEGLTEGLTQGLTQGRTQGRTQGLAQGRTEEAARNLLIILRARGLAVPDTTRERIMAERDLERLERWVEKAVVATSVAAILDEPN